MMEPLIDKDALVAEIENLLDKGKYHEEYDCAFRDGNNGALYALKDKLDTLEVKEVDLKKFGEVARHLIAVKEHIEDMRLDKEEWFMLEKIGYPETFKAQKEEPVSEDLGEASKEWLIPQLDKSYANYGEAKMMELTHFDGYAMLDAIEFGAKWQEAKDQEIIETAIHHAYHNGRLEMKQQMMTNTADAMIGLPYENKDGGYTHLIDVSRPLPVGNNKIAIIFKEE